jgi:hypothetical protein
MDISPWIKTSDRRPTQADLPVELYFGGAVCPEWRGPVVAEYLTAEQARRSLYRNADESLVGVRYVEHNDTFTHWRRYRPLTPAQLEVKDTEVKGHCVGGAGTRAFHIAMRCARLDPQAYPQFETIALEIEAYAKNVASKAVEDHKNQNTRSILEQLVDDLQLRICALNEQLKQAEAAKREAEGKVSGQLFTITRLEGQVSEERDRADKIEGWNNRQKDSLLSAWSEIAKLKEQLKQATTVVPADSLTGEKAASIGAYVLIHRAQRISQDLPTH